MAKDQTKARALAALLDSRTLTEAAEKAGITRKTLYSYIRDDLDFATAYKAAQEQMQLERMEAVADDRQRAKDAIIAIMEDEGQPGAVRLKAAVSLLQAADAEREKGATIAAQNVTRNTKDPFDNLFGFGG